MQYRAKAMSISRRALLASASTILLPTAAKSTLLSAVESTASRGRINLDLNGITNHSLIFPFINIWKCADHIQVVADGVSRWSSIAPGVTGSAWDGYIDSNGELVKPLPFNVTKLERVFYAPPVDGLPAGYNRVGEKWVLKWDGIASDVTIAGASSVKRGPNRIVWTWGSNTADMWVTFAGMDLSDPPRNVRLCEGRHEARLDAGEIFNPEWLARVREGSGIIRFMCWQIPNYDISTLRFSDIPDQKYCSYGGLNTRPFSGVNMKPFIKGGMPLSVMSGLANKVQSHPWLCIPLVLGTKKLSAIATISNANPAVVTSPGHKWEDGDQVIPYGTNWPQVEKVRWTVTNSDQDAGTFALAGVDSTSFGHFASKRAAITTPYDLGSIAKELAPFAAYFRDNIAPGLVTYFELGNEIWNGFFEPTHWLTAQARDKFGREARDLMAGYLAAHFMKIIRDTYGVEGRHKWRGVLATQTGNIDVTKRLIAGAKQYIGKHDRSLSITDLFRDVAVTGYFGRNFDNSQKTTVMGWMDLSEQRWENGLEPTKYSYFNRVVNYNLLDHKSSWSAQKAIADANGLGFIQYEGGNGNVPGFFDSLVPAEQVRLMEFYRRSCHTVEDAQNYKLMFSSFVAMGGKYPAKFVEAGPVTRHGNWGALRYPGDRNPVWDAVVAFNARS
jgi:hypothetical protein